MSKKRKNNYRINCCITYNSVYFDYFNNTFKK